MKLRLKMRTHELTLELGNWIRYYATGTIPSLFQGCVSDFIMLPTFLALTGFPRIPSKTSRILEVLWSNSGPSSKHPPGGTHYSFCLALLLFIFCSVFKNHSACLKKALRSKICLLLILSSLSKCALTPARANSRYSINSCGMARSDQILPANSYLSKNINVLDDI